MALIEAGLEMLAESDFTAVGGPEEQIALGDRILAVERRLAPAVYAVVRLLGRFGVARELKFRNLSALLQRTYRMTQREARTVIREADLYAADRALTGEVLATATPEVAAGGVLSRAQARVIEDALQAIPRSHAHLLGAAEARLADIARTLPVDDLKTCGTRILAYLDPDGAPPSDDLDDEEIAARREFSLGRGRDGMRIGSFRCDDELGAYFEAVLSHFGQKNPTPGQPDDRTPRQRGHDAMKEALHTLGHKKGLPERSGFPFTVLLKMDIQQLSDRTGLVPTVLGGTVSIDTLMKYASEAGIIPIVFNGSDPLWCGRKTRYATPAQRAVMYASQGGCTVPGCSTPGLHFDANHIHRYEHGGRTDITNLTLNCSFDHHTRIDQLLRDGWEIGVIRGRTAYTPPAHVDPKREPRYNWKHHPEESPAKHINDP